MKLKQLFLCLVLLAPTVVLAQTNSGENKPTPEETSEGGPGAPHKEAGVTVGEPGRTSKSAEENETPFSLYKDTYLLLGYSDSAFNKPMVFKFQISAKFRMPIPGIYLAYTQRSFMDVLAESAPFTDHNFEPEVYYIYSFSDRFVLKNWLHSMQVGYRHGSNGLDGVNSRSWERIYAEIEFIHGGLYLRPSIWFPFFKEAGNSDVEDYYGYGELTAAYIWDNDIRLSGRFRMGTSWPKGNATVDLTVPFQLFFNTTARGWKQSNLWFQAFQGYGETFLGLHEASTAFAVGVGFRPDFDKKIEKK